jgi:hypothetical protein
VFRDQAMLTSGSRSVNCYGQGLEISITVRMSMPGLQQRRVVDGIFRKLRRAGIMCEVVGVENGFVESATNEIPVSPGF